MNAELTIGFTRRALLVALAGGVATLGRLPFATGVAAAPSRGVGGGGGIAGAGIIDTGGGEVQFSVHASRREIDAAGTLIFAGDLRWEDREAGLSLRSTGVTFYGPPPDDDTAREVRGELSVDGAGSYPFLLRVDLAELAPLSQDLLRLTVAGIAYHAAGSVIFGDVTLLRFGPE